MRLGPNIRHSAKHLLLLVRKPKTKVDKEVCHPLFLPVVSSLVRFILGPFSRALVSLAPAMVLTHLKKASFLCLEGAPHLLRKVAAQTSPSESVFPPTLSSCSCSNLAVEDAMTRSRSGTSGRHATTFSSNSKSSSRTRSGASSARHDLVHLPHLAVERILWRGRHPGRADGAPRPSPATRNHRRGHHTRTRCDPSGRRATLQGPRTRTADTQ
jgi:hypothetical protein